MATFKEVGGELLHSCLPCLRAAPPQLGCFGINGRGAPKHLVNRRSPLRDGDRICRMKAQLLRSIGLGQYCRHFGTIRHGHRFVISDDRLVNDLFQQVALGWEVRIDRLDAHAGPVRDGGEGRRGVAKIDEQLPGRGNDAPSGFTSSRLTARVVVGTPLDTTSAREWWGERPEHTVQMDSDMFPPEFYERADSSPDPAFYFRPRLVTHIDDHAIAAVGALYDELGIAGQVLDLMGSWVSHFRSPPARLTVLGMNSEEVEANPAASVTVVHDLNADPRLPFADATFDAVVCCVSVDYLTRPVEVFTDVARVLRPGGPFVCTFSNRCFPTKAIRGWLYATDEQHCAIVGRYFQLAAGWEQPRSERRTPPSDPGDPLLAVWAYRTDAAVS